MVIFWLIIYSGHEDIIGKLCIHIYQYTLKGVLLGDSKKIYMINTDYFVNY